MTKQPLISVITINYNSLGVTCEMIESVLDNSYRNTEIIVVDNASDENPGPFLNRKYPGIKFLRSEKNLGFAGGNNLGIRVSTGDFLFFLNNDAELTNGVLESLLNLFKRFPRAGIASPKICYNRAKPGGELDIIQYVGTTHVHSLTARNSTLGEGEADRGQYSGVRPTAYAHGAAMMIPRQVLEEVGPMCEDFFLYYEELDWCETIRRAGYEVYVDACVKVYHKESHSVSKISSLKTYYLNRNRILFMRRNRNKRQRFFFWLFLAFFTIPKNSLVYIVKGEWKNLHAFYRAIAWNAGNRKELSPDSTPLTLTSITSDIAAGGHVPRVSMRRQKIKAQ